MQGEGQRVSIEALACHGRFKCGQAGSFVMQGLHARGVEAREKGATMSGPHVETSNERFPSESASHET